MEPLFCFASGITLGILGLLPALKSFRRVRIVRDAVDLARPLQEQKSQGDLALLANSSPYFSTEHLDDALVYAVQVRNDLASVSREHKSTELFVRYLSLMSPALAAALLSISGTYFRNLSPLYWFANGFACFFLIVSLIIYLPESVLSRRSKLFRAGAELVKAEMFYYVASVGSYIGLEKQSVGEYLRKVTDRIKGHCTENQSVNNLLSSFDPGRQKVSVGIRDLPCYVELDNVNQGFIQQWSCAISSGLVQQPVEIDSALAIFKASGVVKQLRFYRDRIRVLGRVSLVAKVASICASVLAIAVCIVAVFMYQYYYVNVPIPPVLIDLGALGVVFSLIFSVTSKLPSVYKANELKQLYERYVRELVLIDQQLDEATVCFASNRDKAGKLFRQCVLDFEALMFKELVEFCSQ